jgi:hypothetical protein
MLACIALYRLLASSAAPPDLSALECLIEPSEGAVLAISELGSESFSPFD